jgi:hypothetical protein
VVHSFRDRILSDETPRSYPTKDILSLLCQVYRKFVLYLSYLRQTRPCGCFMSLKLPRDKMTCPLDDKAGSPNMSQDVMQGINNMSLNEYNDFLWKENEFAVPRAPGA